MKKIFFAVLAMTLLAWIPQADAAKEETYLGMPQSRWEAALDGFPIHNHAEFYKQMKESSDELAQTNDAKHYEKLGSNGSLREKHKDNPLLQLKPKKTRGKYLTNLKLDESDFAATVSLIKVLSQGYSETETAEMMPYIAYCINKNISLQDVRYYCRWFTRTGVPVDVAKERLYRLVSNTDDFDRDILQY